VTNGESLLVTGISAGWEYWKQLLVVVAATQFVEIMGPCEYAEREGADYCSGICPFCDLARAVDVETAGPLPPMSHLRVVVSLKLQAARVVSDGLQALMRLQS